MTYVVLGSTSESLNGALQK